MLNSDWLSTAMFILNSVQKKRRNSMQKVVNSMQITVVAMETNGVGYEIFAPEKNGVRGGWKAISQSKRRSCTKIKGKFWEFKYKEVNAELDKRVNEMGHRKKNQRSHEELSAKTSRCFVTKILCRSEVKSLRWIRRALKWCWQP